MNEQFQPPLPNQPGYPGQPQPMQPQPQVQQPQSPFPVNPVQTQPAPMPQVQPTVSAMPVAPQAQFAVPTAPVMPQPALPAMLPQMQPPVQAMPQQAPAGLPTGFQVFEPDMVEIKRMAEEIAKQGGRRGPSDFYSFKKGDNYIRVLPPWSAERRWFKFASRHYGILGNQSSPCYEASYPGANYVCPIDMVLAVFGKLGIGKELEPLEARGYNYVNGLVYDYDANTQQFLMQRLKPYVIRLPIAYVFEPMLALMGKPPFHQLMNLQQGCILNVNRPESFSGKANYQVQHVWTGPLASDESAVRTIIAQMHNLDTFADFAPPTAEKLTAQLELADGLATALASNCGYTRGQLAQHGLLPEKLAQVGAVSPVAVSTVPTLPTAVPQFAQPAVAPQMPIAQIAPALQMPVAQAAPMVAPPVVSTQPALPVQVQGSASPSTATVTTAPLPVAFGGVPGIPAIPSAPPLPQGPGSVPMPIQPGQVAQPVAQQPAQAAQTTEAQAMCPVCSKLFAGARGLKMHLARSACGGTAPAAQPQPQVQPQAQVQAQPAAQPQAVPQTAAPMAQPNARPPCYGTYGSQVGCPLCIHRNECAAGR